MDRFSLPKHLCANTGKYETPSCPNEASEACSNCFLVQYCSRDCRLVHRPMHEKDCRSRLNRTTWKPSWDVEKRKPAFVTQTEKYHQHGIHKYLWGNMPALDVLNLEQNEGSDFSGTLNVLFAASGDIRNIVKTLASLPETFHGQCNFVVNDMDFDVFARNVILLLVSLHYKPAEATPILIHIWYSALIPEQILRSLRDNILPLIEEVCAEIEGKEDSTRLEKTWEFGSRSLCLVLTKEQWCRLHQFFKVPEGLSRGEAQRIRKSTVLAPHRKDYLERSLYAKKPGWRVSVMKFREYGILLPFGASQKNFDIPNPTLYITDNRWSMYDSADPLAGWPLDEVMSKAPPAKNDIYGSLFFYLQDLLLHYCRRVREMSVNFHLFCLDAVDLPSALKNNGIRFDRIEVSNVSDGGYLGPRKTLDTFSTLLKPKSQNVHATLLCLFMNAVEETCTEFDTVLAFRDSMPRLERYLSVTRHNFPDRGADLIRIISAAKMFRDFETLFGQYMREHEFTKISREAGLEIKEKNTIVSRPFPMQLWHNASQYEFDLLQASGFTGCERYVEWRRIDIGTGTVAESTQPTSAAKQNGSSIPAIAAPDRSMTIFIVATIISFYVLLLLTALMILSWLNSLIMSFCHYVIELATWSRLMHLIMRA